MKARSAPKVKNLLTVPEYIIQDCAANLIDEDNIFQRCLTQGLEYKMADLTPAYINDTVKKTLYVTSQEYLKKLYH